MTKLSMNEFASICGRFNIDPPLALENERIVELLIAIRDTNDANAASGYRNLLIQAFETEF